MKGFAKGLRKGFGEGFRKPFLFPVPVTVPVPVKASLIEITKAPLTLDLVTHTVEMRTGPKPTGVTMND